MIVAEVEVHQVIGTYDCSEESQCAYESQDSIDVNGFQVLPSQVLKKDIIVQTLSLSFSRSLRILSCMFAGQNCELYF